MAEVETGLRRAVAGRVATGVAWTDAVELGAKLEPASGVNRSTVPSTVVR